MTFVNWIRSSYRLILLPADSYGATLFGKSPEDLDYVKTASSVGFGKSDLTKMNIKEITLGA